MILQKEIPIHIIWIYIIAQPFLDVMTGITLQYTDSQLTISLIIRMFFLLTTIFYLLFSKENPYRKVDFMYLVLLIIFFIVQLSFNSYLKPQFHLFAEVKFILKTMYFIVMLLLARFLLKSNGRVVTDKTLQILAVSVTIYSFFIFFAGLTGTGFQSYEFEKVGQVGWFHAGNEIGAILSISLPVVLLFALKKSSWYWISVVITIYALFSIGTKVGLGAIILSLVIGLLTMILENFRKIKDSLSKIGILLALFIGAIIYTPFSPVAKNIDIHLNILETRYEKEQTNSYRDGQSEELQQLMLSGRHQYLNNQLQYFKEAPLSQKLLGMGYGGNYRTEAKMIEMDPFDVFFSFGILGSFLFFIPVIYVLSIMIYCTLRRISFTTQTEYICLVCTCMFSIGISFIAGHVLTAPSVSLYVAFLLAVLVVKVENEFKSS